MNGADIRFVHLGITIEHLKSSISVFGFRIAFYGIIIGIGMLAGIWIASQMQSGEGRIRNFIWILHCTQSYVPLSVQEFIM